MGQTFVQQLSDPFYDKGPERQVSLSVGYLPARRPGLLLAVLVAIPIRDWYRHRCAAL
jgi:hypothetical protein